MKLLFDQNLSPKLATSLVDIFPGSSHVSLQDLDEQTDSVIWEFATENEFIIVTKDSDFVDYSVAFGFPPYVVLIRTGNCDTVEVESLLRNSLAAIDELLATGTTGLLTLY